MKRTIVAGGNSSLLWHPRWWWQQTITPKAKAWLKRAQSRQPISMVAGDEGLVVRLAFRPPAAGHVEPRAYGWEIGLLKRTA